MSKYLELPWSVDDTIEDLKELKEGIQKRLIIQNLHGRGEKDAEEIAFDFDRAIKALEEVQQCREIGNVEECRAAVEKQIAKNPDYDDYHLAGYRCPDCNNVNPWGYKHCKHCGQKLDWSDEE